MKKTLLITLVLTLTFGIQPANAGLFDWLWSKEKTNKVCEDKTQTKEKTTQLSDEHLAQQAKKKKSKLRFTEKNDLISSRAKPNTTVRMGFAFSGVWDFLVARFSAWTATDDTDPLPEAERKALQKAYLEAVLSGEVPKNTEGLSDNWIQQIDEWASGLDLNAANEYKSLMANCPPDIQFISLAGITAFAQLDLTVVCGDADTLAVLLFSNYPGTITNAEVALDLPFGFGYGGSLESLYPGPVVTTAASIMDTDPVIMIDEIAEGEAVILYVTVQADCKASSFNGTLWMDADVNFDFLDSLGESTVCASSYGEVIAFNNAIKTPILNIIDLDGESNNNPTVVISNTTEVDCHTLRISQDGLSAYLNDFIFTADGLDLTGNMNLTSFSVNGNPYTDYQYDSTTMVFTANISGDVFLDNNDPLNNPSDTQFNENEQVTIEICYQIDGCLESGSQQSITFGATFGCYDEICRDPNTEDAVINYIPDLNADAGTVDAGEIIQEGTFCGDNIIWTTSFESANPDPIDGVWNSLIISWEDCENVNFQFVEARINGVAFPITGPSIDLTANTTPVPGLSDEDGDGFIDDMAGGNTIILEVESDFTCAPEGAACGEIVCNLDRVNIRGQRDCGANFNDAAVFDTISYFMGEMDFFLDTFEVDYAGGTLVTESVAMDAACENWETFQNGYTLNYTFGTENVSACTNSNIYMEVSVTGSEMKRIRVEDGSATYMGAPFPITDIVYETELENDMVTLDTVGLTFTIPAGDNANDNTEHQYYFNLEALDHCSSSTLYTIDMQVVEECLDCAEVDPCLIYRSCHGVQTLVAYNGSSCCVALGCPVRSFVDKIERTNFGYTDKTMTTKVDPATIPAADLNHFLPGDTMLLRVGYEILDLDALIEAGNNWRLSIINTNWTGAGRPDIHNAYFNGWYIEDGTTGAVQQVIDMPGMPDFEDRIDDVYPSVILSNFGVSTNNEYCNDPTAVDFCGTEQWVNPDYAIGGNEYGYVLRSFSPGNLDTEEGSQEMRIYWGVSEGCYNPNIIPTCYGLSGTEDAVMDQIVIERNNNLANFIDTYGLENGDIIYIEQYLPIMHNPLYDLAILDGLNPSTTGSFLPVFESSNSCLGAVANNNNTCREAGTYDTRLPGDIILEQDINIENCNASVTYTFKIDSLVPALPDGEAEWFQNEYRPLMYAEYIQPNFPTNMFYTGGAYITDDLGNQTMMDDYLDTDYGNLTCESDGAGGECCIAADGSNSASMRFIDDSFYETFEISGFGRDIIPSLADRNLCTDGEPYTHQPGTYPVLGIGGGGDECEWSFTYELTTICPADITANDFTLTAQFAEHYLANLDVDMYVNALGQDNNNCNTAVTGTNDYISFNNNPYGTDCTQWDGCTALGGYDATYGFGCKYPFANIHPHADLSTGVINGTHEGGLNPQRKRFLNYGPDATSIVANNQSDYPVLTPTVDQDLIADLIDENEIVTHTICADNLAGGATHTNVVTSFTLDNTIQLVDVIDPVTGTSLSPNTVDIGANQTTYNISSADIAPGECIDIQIVTELLFCPAPTDPAPTVCVGTTSSCVDADKVTALTSSGEACSSAQICYAYIKEDAELQAEWTLPDGTEYDLCGEIEFEILIKNVREAVLLNLDPVFTIPFGLQIVPGSWEAAYPGGPTTQGAWQPVTDATFAGAAVLGNRYQFNSTAEFSAAIAASGLPGVSGNSAIDDENKIAIRFKAVSICDEFVSGSRAYLETFASDPCESTISSGLVESLPVVITNANPDDFAKLLTFADPIFLQCGSGSTTLTLTTLNISPVPSFTDQTRMCIVFSNNNLNYTPGTATFTSPSGFNGNATETALNGATQICVDLPDGIGQGQQASVSFDVTLEESTPCGLEQIGVDISSFLEEEACVTGPDCGVYVTNGVNNFIDIAIESEPRIIEFEATALCVSGNGSIDVGLELVAAEASVGYTDDLIITAYADLNNDGILDDFDPAIDATTVTVNVAAGDILIVNAELTISEDLACGFLIDVARVSSCQCNSSTIAISGLKPDFLADLAESETACEGEDFDIAVCGDYTYVLNPSDGGTITETANNLNIVLADGQGIAEPVVLEVTGGFGACDTTYTLNLIRAIGSDAPVIGVIDNVCADNVIGEFIVITPCSPGNVIEWSRDNGTTWSTTSPTYDGANGITAIARCVSNVDATCIIAGSSPVTSAPNNCCPTPNCFGISVQQN